MRIPILKYNRWVKDELPRTFLHVLRGQNYFPRWRLHVARHRRHACKLALGSPGYAWHSVSRTLIRDIAFTHQREYIMIEKIKMQYGVTAVVSSFGGGASAYTSVSYVDPRGRYVSTIEQSGRRCVDAQECRHFAEQHKPLIGIVPGKEKKA